MLDRLRWCDSRLDPADPLRQHLLPHPLLRPYIAHYTLYYPYDSAEPMLNVVPDASGCLLFTVDDSRAEGVFIGASTRAITVPNRRTPPRLFVEFRPGGAHRLLDLPHAEMQDCRMLLDALLPALSADIVAAVEQATDTGELACALDVPFLCRMPARPDPHPAVSALLAGRHPGGELPTVRGLARDTGYSERHLSRIVREHLGVGLKSYLRMVRINRIIERLHHEPGNLAALAAEAGYFDQAHFTRDFRDTCGATPTAYLSAMSGFYHEPFKF